MKKFAKLLLSSALLGSLFFGCKVVETETEYVEKIVEKEVEKVVYKTYASSVTFTATSDEGKVNVTMASETEDATIYYTTDGTNPSTESTVYSEAISITDDTEFRAIAVKSGLENSPISYANFSVVNKIETQIETKIEYKDREVEKIVTNEVEKEYASAVSFETTATDDGVTITMATSTAGATIYYTTDGTNPTAESTAYNGAITVTKNTTLKAIAIKNEIENSPISVATVSIVEKSISDTQIIYRNKTYASPVTFTPTGTDDGVSLVLSTSTENAKIYYTTDGSTPTAESTEYSTAINLTASTTIKAIAIKDEIEDSPISVATVTIR